MKKNVLIVGPSLHVSGGISTFLNEVFRTFKGSASLSLCYFDTYAAKGRADQRQRSKLSFREVLGLFEVLRSFVSEVKKHKDLTGVVLNTSSYWGFWEKTLLAIVLKLLRVPCRVIVHGADFLDWYTKSNLKAVIRLALLVPSRIYWVSPQHYEVFKTLVPVEQKVLKLPVSSPLLEGVEIDESIALFASEYSFVFLVLCVLEPRKRVLDVIKTFTQVFEEKDSVGLIVAGDGMQGAEVQKMCSQLRNVHYTGNVETSRKASVFSVSDCFINFSKQESFGLVIIEAFLGRCICISTDVGVASFHRDCVLIANDKHGLRSSMRKAVNMNDTEIASLLERADAVSKGYLSDNAFSALKDVFLFDAVKMKKQGS